MKIAIDGSPFTKNPLGISKIFIPIIEEMVLRNPSIEYIIYSNKEIVVPANLSKFLKVKKSCTIFKYLPYIIWLKLVAGFILRKDKVDAYFSGKGFFPIIRSIKKIAIVHDLNYLIVPETMEYSHYLAHKYFLKKDVLKTDFLISNSIGTAKKIQKHWGRKVDLVINTPIDISFKHLNSEDVNKVLNRHNINYKYLFTVGTVEPRKNLALTINVFIDLIRNGMNKEHKLVIAGAKGWKNSKVIDLLDKYSDSIIHLGYVKDEDLPALYNGATAFLFPSIYEGFGTPVREALLCGTQIITSDIEELKESSYNNAYYINPNNYLEYKQRILDVLSGKKITHDYKHVKSNTDKLINYINNITENEDCNRSYPAIQQKVNRS